MKLIIVTFLFLSQIGSTFALEPKAQLVAYSTDRVRLKYPYQTLKGLDGSESIAFFGRGTNKTRLCRELGFGAYVKRSVEWSKQVEYGRGNFLLDEMTLNRMGRSGAGQPVIQFFECYL